MLVKLLPDEKEILEQNRFLLQMREEEPDDDYWQRTKLISTLDDVFLPYDKWFNSFSNKDKKKYFKVPETFDDSMGIYIVDGDPEGYLKRLATLKAVDSLYLNSKFYHRRYGVCDNYSQAIEKYKELVNDGVIDKDENIVIMLVPLFRERQSQFGWRWKKWGRYVGIQERKHEYLYDEKNIELVFSFEIFVMR